MRSWRNFDIAIFPTSSRFEFIAKNVYAYLSFILILLLICRNSKNRIDFFQLFTINYVVKKISLRLLYLYIIFFSSGFCTKYSSITRYRMHSQWKVQIIQIKVLFYTIHIHINPFSNNRLLYLNQQTFLALYLKLLDRSIILIVLNEKKRQSCIYNLTNFRESNYIHLYTIDNIEKYRKYITTWNIIIRKLISRNLWCNDEFESHISILHTIEMILMLSLI